MKRGGEGEEERKRERENKLGLLDHILFDLLW